MVAVVVVSQCAVVSGRGVLRMPYLGRAVEFVHNI